jgi:hypothetical protein
MSPQQKPGMVVEDVRQIASTDRCDREIVEW